METLAETKTCLEDIKKQNKEIIGLIDELEKRRKQQPSLAENVSAAETASCHGDANSNDTDKVSDTEKETVTNVTDNSELKLKLKQDSTSLIDQNTDNNSSESEQIHTAESACGLDTKAKGILKTPDKGSKNSYGFKERLNLEINHVMYGSQLRRTAVELQQDNRLCLQFGLPPNEGSMYESKRSFPDEQDTASRPDDVIGPRIKYSKNGQTLQEPTRKAVRVSETVNEGSTALHTSAEGRTKKTSEFAVRLEYNKERSNKEEQVTPEQKHLTAVSKAEKESLRHDLQVKEATMKLKTKQEKSHQQDNGQDSQKPDGKISQKQEGKKLQEAKGNPDNFRANIGPSVLKTKMSEHAEVDNKGDTSESNLLTYTAEEQCVHVDADTWIQYANEEIKNGRIAREIRERGMDTIFCVDVSQSMKGIAWQQCTTFVKNFVEGIQNTTLNDEVFEHVALVTYGSETRVHQHLTCDYLEFNRKFGRLKPNGPSPLYAGLQMVHAAIIGAGGGHFSCAGYKMHPRVFLISDGKPTPLSLFAGPDNHAADNFGQDEILHIVLLVKELNDKFDVTINPVPVGDFDLNILNMIAEHSNGKIVSPEDWRLQSRVFKNKMTAAKLAAAASKAGPGVVLTISDPTTTKFLLDSLSPDASPEDKEQIHEFLRTQSKGDDEDSENKEIDDFPPLGSRVCRRIPFASAGKGSEGELGTVTKHMSDGHKTTLNFGGYTDIPEEYFLSKPGYIGVTWDRRNADGAIREKVPYQDGYKCVTIVDKPRILKDEMIAEGCRVKRGRDWHYGDQDGGDGKFGNVFIVNPNGIVSVRWDNGNKYTYLFGADGKFDLEIVGQNEDVKKSDGVPTSSVLRGNATHHLEQSSTDESLYTIPSDEETEEEKRVKEMNKRNQLIYDLVSPDISVQGAGSEPKGDSLFVHDILEQKKHKGEKREKRSKSETSRNISVSNSELQRSPPENDKGRSISKKRDAANISIESGSADSDYKVKMSTEKMGAKPKTNVMKKPDPQEEVTVHWLWKDGDTWKEYPPEISVKIETDFKRNPRGTTLIQLNNVPFRVVFPRMEQINIGTKDKCAVLRKT